jgi:methylenetetrahydrofolate dehydrogenase (NADP+)/methenyltetrahydrofolate cyclohydrolase
MTARLIDGKGLAAQVSSEVRQRAEAFATEHGRPPGLDVVLVGEHAPSQVYVRNKERAARKAGIRSTIHRLPGDVSQQQLLDKIRALNADDAVDGILVQLPLPEAIDPLVALEAIEPEKDVDGLHPFNAGLLSIGRRGLRPCTPLGCMRILNEIDCDPAGKNAVVIGASNLAGKPMGLMLLERGATVTYCHMLTRDVVSMVQTADIVVVAAGSPELVKGEWIREGAVVLDVGINRTSEGRLIGDVQRRSVAAKAAWLTPVPGGVGPMTVAMLLSNTLDAAEHRGQPRAWTSQTPPSDLGH